MAAFIWSSLCMVVAAVALYYLGRAVLNDEKLAVCAALLFCCNPAIVFLTAAYSESLFAALGFSAMLAWTHQHNWLTAFLIGIATGTRSNGTLLVGFLLYGALKQWLNAFSRRGSLLSLFCSTVKQCLVLALQCCLAVMPFCAYQYYMYMTYCFERSFSVSEHQRQPLAHTSSLPWCNATVPWSYSSIQSRYWDVGFLRYFQMKQVPNFMLCSPVVLMVLSCAWHYIQSCHLGTLWTLGLMQPIRWAMKKKLSRYLRSTCT